jgi:hypothetical protein
MVDTEPRKVAMEDMEVQPALLPEGMEATVDMGEAIPVEVEDMGATVKLRPEEEGVGEVTDQPIQTSTSSYIIVLVQFLTRQTRICPSGCI